MIKTVRIYWTIRHGLCEKDDRTHSEGETLAVTVRSILLIKHVVQCGDLPVRIGNLVHDRQRAEDSERARTTIGNWTLVGPYLEPYSLISLIQLW